MTWWTATPTLGSLAAGLFFAVRAIITWWPGLPGKGVRFDVRDAITSALPFLLAYAYGMLVILGVGGLIGAAANFTLWGVGWVGDSALVWGAGGTRASVSGEMRRMALSNGGLMIVLLATAVVIGVRARCSRETRTAIGRGVLAGILTGTVASISGALAVPLASLVNQMGSWLPGVST